MLFFVTAPHCDIEADHFQADKDGLVACFTNDSPSSAVGMKGKNELKKRRPYPAVIVEASSEKD